MSIYELCPRIFLALAVGLVLSRLLSGLSELFRQPRVVGEMLAGLILGPSVLGAVWGDPTKWVFSTQVLSTLSMVSQIGLVVYLFFVGLDLGESGLGKGGRSMVIVSLSSLFVPFAFGVVLSSYLYRTGHAFGGHVVHPVAFAIFFGTACSTTAFPVLCRILTDSGMESDRLGRLAVRCAALLDAFGWILLAIALAIASSNGFDGLLRIVLEATGLLLVIAFAVRPVLKILLTGGLLKSPRFATAIVGSVVVVCTFASAEVTQWIGLHLMLGAAVFGALFPRDANPAVVARMRSSLEGTATKYFLPLYFLLPGLTINLRVMDLKQLRDLLLILAVACAGKFLGAGGGSRLAGLGRRDSAAMGALMNTRGLIELVILNVGLSAHILDRTLYGLMVVMALATTMMTGPLLNVLYIPYAQSTLARRRLSRSQTFASGQESGAA